MDSSLDGYKYQVSLTNMHTLESCKNIDNITETNSLSKSLGTSSNSTHINGKYKADSKEFSSSLEVKPVRHTYPFVSEKLTKIGDSHCQESLGTDDSKYTENSCLVSNFPSLDKLRRTENDSASQNIIPSSFYPTNIECVTKVSDDVSMQKKNTFENNMPVSPESNIRPQEHFLSTNNKVTTETHQLVFIKQEPEDCDCDNVNFTTLRSEIEYSETPVSANEISCVENQFLIKKEILDFFESGIMSDPTSHGSDWDELGINGKKRKRKQNGADLGQKSKKQNNNEKIKTTKSKVKVKLPVNNKTKSIRESNVARQSQKLKTDTKPQKKANAPGNTQSMENGAMHVNGNKVTKRGRPPKSSKEKVTVVSDNQSTLKGTKNKLKEPNQTSKNHKINEIAKTLKKQKTILPKPGRKKQNTNKIKMLEDVNVTNISDLTSDINTCDSFKKTDNSDDLNAGQAVRRGLEEKMGAYITDANLAVSHSNIENLQENNHGENICIKNESQIDVEYSGEHGYSDNKGNHGNQVNVRENTGTSEDFQSLDADIKTESQMVNYETETTVKKEFDCGLCGKRCDSSIMLEEHHLQTHPQSMLSCDYCGKKFMSMYGLKCHVHIHAADNAFGFQCEECGKQFVQRSNYEAHMRIHTGVKPFECDQCGRKFTQRGNMERHVLRHLGRKPFVCSFCGQSFDKKERFEKHVLKHAGHKQFQCTVCDLKFSRSFELKVHSKIHKVGKQFECHICNKKLQGNSNLQLHIRTHTGERPYSCEECGKSFGRLNHLQLHMSTHSGFKPYVCDLCGKSFNQVQGLNYHMKVHNDEKEFECHVCKKKFVQKSNLLRHIPTHSDEKAHVCNICGKTFKKKESLQGHIRGHSGDLPYKCDICGKGFTRKDHLPIHARTHTGEKPYKCTECGKGFAQSNQLYIHKRVHTGEKPFECKICDRKFAQLIGLKRHACIANKSKPVKSKNRKYKCEVCDEHFNTAGELRKHAVSHAGEKCTCEVCGHEFSLYSDIKDHTCVKVEPMNENNIEITSNMLNDS